MIDYVYTRVVMLNDREEKYQKPVIVQAMMSPEAKERLTSRRV